MTTYAPDWTPRWKGSYSVLSAVHSLQLRAPRGTDAAGTQALADVAHDFVAALAASLTSDFAWIEASYALTDSDFFIPTDVPAPVTGGNDPVDFSLMQKISPLIFSGRSASGRARVSIYGVSLGPLGISGDPLDFQILASEDASVAAAIAVLQAGAVGAAGEVTVWHMKATQKPNDRLVKRARQGLIS